MKGRVVLLNYWLLQVVLCVCGLQKAHHTDLVEVEVKTATISENERQNVQWQNKEQINNVLQTRQSDAATKSDKDETCKITKTKLKWWFRRVSSKGAGCSRSWPVCVLVQRAGSVCTAEVCGSRGPAAEGSAVGSTARRRTGPAESPPARLQEGARGQHKCEDTIAAIVQQHNPSAEDLTSILLVCLVSIRTGRYWKEASATLLVVCYNCHFKYIAGGIRRLNRR